MITVDSTLSSTVAVCSCGWRYLADSRRGAWLAARDHERVAHPGATQAESNLRFV